MESFFKSAVVKVFAIYWGVLICLVYFAKWVDRNSHYLALAGVLVAIGLVASFISVVAFRYYRRW